MRYIFLLLGIVNAAFVPHNISSGDLWLAMFNVMFLAFGIFMFEIYGR